MFSYKNTPNILTGETLAKLFLNRQPRTRLSLLKPNLADLVEAKQEKQKFQHDGKLPLREFIPRDSVYVRNFRGGSKWNPGVIQALLGPVSYIVNIQNHPSVLIYSAVHHEVFTAGAWKHESVGRVLSEHQQGKPNHMGSHGCIIRINNRHCHVHIDHIRKGGRTV